MKIKHLALLVFLFVAYVPSVYSQIDITQLEALQQLQQEEQGSDESIQDKRKRIDRLTVAANLVVQVRTG